MAIATIIVKGRVQGVFYRHSTREHANLLGLSGWVRNLPDGTVEIEARGSRRIIDKLVQWCHTGPPGARVEGVVVNWLDGTEGEQARNGSFTIRAD